LKEFFNDVVNFFTPGTDKGKNIMVSTPKVKSVLLGIVSPDSILPAYGGFDKLPEGIESNVQMCLIHPGKTFSSEVTAKKGDSVEYSFVCKEGEITGSFGFKKEGKKYLDDKNSLQKKDSGKGSYEPEKTGAFVISFANEDPVGDKTVYFRLAVISKGEQQQVKAEKRKSTKKSKRGESKQEVE
jgi:hypothetical protein